MKTYNSYVLLIMANIRVINRRKYKGIVIRGVIHE